MFELCKHVIEDALIATLTYKSLFLGKSVTLNSPSSAIGMFFSELIDLWMEVNVGQGKPVRGCKQLEMAAKVHSPPQQGP